MVLQSPQPYDPAVSIPTLIGSILSFVATACVVVGYLVWPQGRTFRHAMVLNLAAAEMVGTLDRLISGIVVVSHNHKLDMGPWCTVNGFIGQLSLQGADFSILAIALVTLTAVKRKYPITEASFTTKALIIASIWVIPIITSIIALAEDAYSPLPGNWCWISQERTDLRYALTHGWRFAIMLSTIGIYVYIYVFLRSHFTRLSVAQMRGHGSESSSSSDSSVTRSRARRSQLFSNNFAAAVAAPPSAGSGGGGSPVDDAKKIHVHHLVEISHEDCSEKMGGNRASVRFEDGLNVVAAAVEMVDQASERRRMADEESGRAGPVTATTTTTTAAASRSFDPATATALSGGTRTVSVAPSRRSACSVGGSRSNEQLERHIKRMLLLNAYPIMYVILWLPGIVCRLVQATGHNYRWSSIMMCSTQYVGLAVAITYGFSERAYIISCISGRLRRRS